MTRSELLGILIGAPIGFIIARTAIWLYDEAIWLYDRKKARRG